MTTQKKTLEELLLHRIKFIGDNDQTYIGYPAELIAEIQALVAEAIPSEKEGQYKLIATSYGGLSNMGADYYIDKGYNQALDAITTALIERGLLPEKENKE